MTKAEKIQIWVAIGVCFISSVLVPYLFYLYLQPSFREAQVRLHALLADGEVETSSTHESLDRKWSVRIENTAPLPVSSVGLILRGAELVAIPDKEIRVDPPYPFKIQRNADELRLTFEGSMAPSSVVKVGVARHYQLRKGKLTQPLRDISGWVYSEGSEMLPIFWRGTFSVGITVSDSSNPPQTVSRTLKLQAEPPRKK